MRILFKNIHTFLLFICFAISGCGSNPSVTEIQEGQQVATPKFMNKQENSLGDIFEHPQLYIDRTIAVSGLVQATEIRKLTKYLSLLTVKLSEGQGEVQLHSKFHFIEKLREAEDLVSENRYKNIRLSSTSAKKFYENACDLKIASSRLKPSVTTTMVWEKLRWLNRCSNFLRYSDLGESYVSFHKAALASSPCCGRSSKK